MGAYDVGLTYSAARAHDRTMSQSDLAELCTTAGWVHDNAQAICIIMAESSGQTGVVSTNNPAGPDHRNIGLFQIWAGNVQHPDYLKDPVYNANVARRIYHASGNSWKQWATASQCAGKSGNVQPGDEATNALDDAVSTVTDIPGQVLGGITGILNSIPWFRIGKGAFGFVLLVAGIGAMVVMGMNKAPTPINMAGKALNTAGKTAGKAGAATGRAVGGVKTN